MQYSMLPFILAKEEMAHWRKVAIFTHDQAYTYGQLNEWTGKFASGLTRRLQLKQGDVLAIQSSNTIEYVITLLACLRLGVALTPLNPALKADEIYYQLKKLTGQSVYL